jgi:hypothetical protein
VGPRTWGTLAAACAALIAIAVAIGGCVASSSDEPGTESAGATASTGLPCAVADVFARNCKLCHGASPTFGAPMPLVTADNLHAPAVSNPAKKVYEMVGVRIHDPQRPMPPIQPLPAADMQTLDAWIAAGAPRSAATCQTTPTGDGGADVLPCTPDQSLAPANPWPVQADLDDDYVCYGVDVTTAAKRHAIAIAPRVQNDRVLHHLDVYEAPESFGREPRRCSAFGSAEWRMVFAWAPGGKSLVLPPEAGFPLQGTTHYVVQMHYSNVAHLSGETDASGVDMCTTDQLRANDADVMAFGTDHFVIPPRSNYDLTCRVALASTGPDLRLFAVMPHMHGLGRSMVHTLHPRGGAPPINLATQANWDINNQSWFAIDATLRAGDRVATRCGWTNTTDEPVYFGDASADEMCYAFTMYYPRITEPSWNWSLPASQSSCTVP